ncbi:hypothetical protein ASD65_09040 [Microbacterium sp. Root61]|uniref:DUF2804 domain-containing protein n=1 Tax=Microbacterium sp. Root61 TaxID=1736570 RepID=UPI0006F2C391|nr:DUF2804 domain-containing protein [Microbacterium sp. Root61]KRA24546.1 hypothetical protein ASD65_09040 [Microbacterium sp. Root61]
MTAHEITTPVALVRPDGRLDPASIGWTRRQLHDTDRIGRGWYGWGRNKRWEYWGIVTPTHIVALTIAALDFANVRQLWILDRTTHESIDTFEIRPLNRGVSLAGTHGRGPNCAHGPGLSLRFDEAVGGTRLRARTSRVRVDLFAETRPGHEAMGIASPHSRRLVDYTVKDVDRPTRGTLTIDDVIYDASGFAVLDHARSRGPYRTDWNWGAAVGEVDGRRIGINLGGGGPRGLRHGLSHTAFTVDGRVHKIPTVLEWEFDHTDWMKPWRLFTDRVELTFTPFYDRYARTNLLVIRSTTHQCFGTFRGRVQTDEGEWITVDGLEGWAEDVHNRW